MYVEMVQYILVKDSFDIAFIASTSGEEDLFAAFLIMLVYCSCSSIKNRIQHVTIYLEHFMTIMRRLSSPARKGQIWTWRLWAVTFSILFDSFRALPAFTRLIQLHLATLQDLRRLYRLTEP